MLYSNWKNVGFLELEKNCELFILQKKYFTQKLFNLIYTNKFTCSLVVTAQKAISLKPWAGNI